MVKFQIHTCDISLLYWGTISITIRFDRTGADFLHSGKVERVTIVLFHCNQNSSYTCVPTTITLIGPSLYSYVFDDLKSFNAVYNRNQFGITTVKFQQK